jgi:peptide-methionine (S)-S-oxide reductase
MNFWFAKVLAAAGLGFLLLAILKGDDMPRRGNRETPELGQWAAREGRSDGPAPSYSPHNPRVLLSGQPAEGRPLGPATSPSPPRPRVLVSLDQSEGHPEPTAPSDKVEKFPLQDSGLSAASGPSSQSRPTPGQEPERFEMATLGGGCFWCLEAIFRQLRGVRKVISGYSGGHVKNPTYKQVCTGTTGHAEVVQILFDPRQISYEELLEVFFAVHDPTTPNRQGPDIGPQYRSIILYHNPQQRATALRIIDQLNRSGQFAAPIVTEVVPFQAFYPAEDYHQDYFRQNPTQPYCLAVIAPKVAKFQKLFRSKLQQNSSEPDKLRENRSEPAQP